MTRSVPALTLGLTLALTGLAACSDGNSAYNAMATMSQQGVGFGDYQRHMRAQLAAGNAGAQRQGTPYSIPPETPAAQARAPLAAPGIGQGPLPVTPARGAAPPVPQPAVPQPAMPQPAAPTQAAVTPAGPEAERPAGLADSTTFTPIPFGARPAGAEIPPSGPAAEMVRVAAVPTGAAQGPNVMAFALSTRHNVGTPMYRRTNPLRWARWERACLQFASQDLAQEAFLAAGGPERDPQNLDPDGDGFACWWDPTVLRRAAGMADPVAGETVAD